MSSEASIISESDVRKMLERLEYELTLPCQSQHIRDDVRECVAVITRLLPALTTAEQQISRAREIAMELQKTLGAVGGVYDALLSELAALKSKEEM
jgi:hypothetical protein